MSKKVCRRFYQEVSWCHVHDVSWWWRNSSLYSTSRHETNTWKPENVDTALLFASRVLTCYLKVPLTGWKEFADVCRFIGRRFWKSSPFCAQFVSRWVKTAASAVTPSSPAVQLMQRDSSYATPLPKLSCTSAVMMLDKTDTEYSSLEVNESCHKHEYRSCKNLTLKGFTLN